MACLACEHIWKLRAEEASRLVRAEPQVVAPTAEVVRPVPQAPKKTSPRRRLIVMAAAASLVLLGGGFGLYAVLAPEPAPVVDVPLTVSTPRIAGGPESGVMTIGFDVQNGSSFTKPLTRACIALRDKNELDIFSWCERMSLPIGSGERRAAEMHLANPPAGVAAVAINVN